MTAEDVRGLPETPVRAWLRDAVPEFDDSAEWQPQVISGGLSNITYRIPGTSGGLILRRPPLGELLPRAHDVAREFRVMAALASTPVPVAEPLALCSDLGVLGVPFYVMREVPGEVFRSADSTGALSPSQRSAIADGQIGRAHV